MLDITNLTLYEHVARSVRAEMVRHGITFADLNRRLRENLYYIDEKALQQRIRRGKFDVLFLAAVAKAMDCQIIMQDRKP